MSAFNQNDIDDLIYDLLDVSEITDVVPNTRIVANRVAPNTEPVYPLIQYQVWNRFRPEYVINNGKITHMGSMRVVVWTSNDPRTAKSTAALIEDALVLAPSQYPLVGGGRVVNFRVDPEEGYIYSEDEREDDRVYIQAGAIYEIEVES